MHGPVEAEARRRRSASPVREVHQHADAVHLRDHGSAERAQPGVVRHLAAVTHQAWAVVGQPHDPDPEAVEHLDQVRVLTQLLRALEMQQDRQPAGLVGSRTSSAVSASNSLGSSRITRYTSPTPAQVSEQDAVPPTLRTQPAKPPSIQSW